jgi:hypothetical protein
LQTTKIPLPEKQGDLQIPKEKAEKDMTEATSFSAKK